MILRTRTARCIAIKVHASHPLDRFVTLNPFLLASLQDLLVFDPELATGDIVAIAR